MLIHSPIIGSRLILKSIIETDIRSEYLSWLQDDEVIRFLEVKYESNNFTLDVLKKYIREVNLSGDSILLGIFLKLSHVHIGNIKLGPINMIHERSEIGLLIGNKMCWGKGYASEAISLLTKYAFQNLKLKKITAGCYDNNIGSIKSFLKSGYKVEGVLHNHWNYEGKKQNGIILGITSND